MTRIWERPVNTKVDGKWKPVETALKAAGDGFVKADGDLNLAVPGSLARPLRVADGEDWLELRLQGSDAAAKVSGATATYAGAGKGVDLKVTAFGDSLKEDLILAGPDSQASFTYEVGLSDGLKLELRKDGGADVINAKGKVVFAIPAPVAQDAKGKVAAGEDASLSYADGKLTVSLSKEWLTAKDRAFPVHLDPSAVPGASLDTFTDEITPTTTYGSSGDLYIGREAAGHDHNALLRFDVANEVPAGAFVQAASVNVWPKYQTASTGSKNLEAREITADWDANATWVKRTSAANWGTAGGDFGPVLDTEPIGVDENKSFTVTDTVLKWIGDSSSNRGIALTDGSSTVDRAVAVGSSEWVDPAARPYLEIEYFPRSGNLDNFTIDSQAISDRQTLGVNVAGGNLILESQDLSVAAKGLPVSVNRYYNSGDDNWGGQFGEKGRISLGNDIVLYECDTLGSRCLIGPSGFRARFKYDGTAKYVTPANIGNFTLERASATSGGFTLTDNTSGVKWKFFDNPWSFNNQIIDRYGNALNLSAAGNNGSLSKITDANSREYPILTDGAGRITKISAPSGSGVDWSYGYDTSGNLTSVTDPENKTTTYTYTGGDITKITDGRGYDTTIGYDTDGRVTSVTRQVDATSANDLTTTYAYPAVGSACDKVGAAPGTADPAVVGQTEVTDPRGKKTTYCYDVNARVVKTVNADNKATTTEYAAKGNISKITGFAGTANVAQQFDFDNGSGGTGYKLTKIKGGAGEETNLTYKAATSDPLQQFRVDEVTDSLGNVTGYGYDTDGNVNSVDNATGSSTGTQNVQLQWDTSSSSSLRGTLTWSKDGNGNQTSYGYDSFGRLETINAPSILGQTKLTYDSLSRIKTVTKGYTTPGSGKVTTYNYDKLDRITSVVDNGAVTQTFGYDANGNNTTRSEPGKSSSYSYDRANRRLTESFPGASSSYTWDKSGNLKTLTDVSGTVTYDYDNINRVTQITAPAVSGTDITSYGYTDPTSSALGATTATLPGGGTIKTTRDNSGKVTEVLVKNGSTQTLKRTYGYTKSASPTVQRSQLITATEQAGSAGAVTNKSYEYDASGRVIEAKTMDASFAQTAKDTFSLDGAGNRKLRTRVTGSSTAYTSYAYNAVNQLCWRSATNVASPSCTSTPAGATSFTYDADGNQLTGDVALTYDDKGRLATLGGASVTHLSPTNWELTAVGSTSFRNTILGVNYINAAGNINKIQRTSEDGAAVSQVRDSAKRWFVTDQIGSTIALVDSAGTVQRTYAYDIDGNDTTTGTGPATQIKFAGGHEVGSGLYHFGHRYYQPSIGRWTQQDPLLQPKDLGQSNRYSYVAGNPLNATDPTGLVSDIGEAIGEVGGEVATVAGAGACAATGAGALVAAGCGAVANVAFDALYDPDEAEAPGRKKRSK